MYRAKEAFELLLWGIRSYNWNGKLFFQQIYHDFSAGFNNFNDFFYEFFCDLEALGLKSSRGMLILICSASAINAYRPSLERIPNSS